MFENVNMHILNLAVQIFRNKKVNKVGQVNNKQ